MAGKNERYAEKKAPDTSNGTTAVDDHAEDIPKTIEGADEADRIVSLISQSKNAIDMFPVPPPRGRYGQCGNYRGGSGGRGGRGGRGCSGYGKFAFGGEVGPQGNAFGHLGNLYPDRAPRPSANYVCHRCNQPGLWIDQYPTNGDPTYDKIKVRDPTGIPRSMLGQVDAPESGTGLKDSLGHSVKLQPNEEESAWQNVGLRLSQAARAEATKKGDDVSATAEGNRNREDAVQAENTSVPGDNHQDDQKTQGNDTSNTPADKSSIETDSASGPNGIANDPMDPLPPTENENSVPEKKTENTNGNSTNVLSLNGEKERKVEHI